MFRLGYILWRERLLGTACAAAAAAKLSFASIMPIQECSDPKLVRQILSTIRTWYRNWQNRVEELSPLIELEQSVLKTQKVKKLKKFPIPGSKKRVKHFNHLLEKRGWSPQTSQDKAVYHIACEIIHVGMPEGVYQEFFRLFWPRLQKYALRVAQRLISEGLLSSTIATEQFAYFSTSYTSVGS